MGNQKKDSKMVRFAIIIAISVIINFCVPESYDLTPKGITYLAIFVGSVLCWIFVDTAWPSILAMAVLIMTNVMNVGQVGAGSIGSTLVIAVMCATVIAGTMAEFGVLRYFAKWLISRRIVHGRPYVFAAIWCLAVYLVVAMSGHIFAYTLFLPLLHELCEEMGYKRGDKFHLMLTMMLLWCGIVAEGVIPFTSMTALTAIGLMSNLGYSGSTFAYLKLSFIPGLIVPIVTALIVAKYILKPDTGKFMSYDDLAARHMLKREKISVQGKITFGVFLLWIVFGGIVPGISILGGLSVWASGVSIAGFALFAIAILCIISIDGKPIVNLATDYNKVPWKAIIFTSAILLFSTTISSADYGIVSSMTKLLFPVASALSLPLVIVVGAMVIITLTNVTSNVVSCVVGLTAFLPVIQQMGASDGTIYCVGILFTMLSSMACLMPSASAGTPIIMGQEADMKEIFPYSLVFILMNLVLLVIILGVLAVNIVG